MVCPFVVTFRGRYVRFILSGTVPDAGVGAFTRRALAKANEGRVIAFFPVQQVRKLSCAGWRRAWRIGFQLAVIAAKVNQWVR